MTNFFIWILTALLVLDCLFLILLVLVQLPKKDAGAGIAFGGGTADALFGAGSGNVLTKVTKWATTIFFVLAIALSIMQSRAHTKRSMLTSLPPPTESALPASPSAPPSSAPTVPAANTSTPALAEKISGLLSTNAAGNTPAPPK